MSNKKDKLTPVDKIYIDFVPEKWVKVWGKIKIDKVQNVLNIVAIILGAIAGIVMIANLIMLL